MDLDLNLTFDLAPAPGRLAVTLTDHWTACLLAPVPGVLILGLFCDKALVEVVDDALDVASYLRSSAALRHAARAVSLSFGADDDGARS